MLSLFAYIEAISYCELVWTTHRKRIRFFNIFNHLNTDVVVKVLFFFSFTLPFCCYTHGPLKCVIFSCVAFTLTQISRLHSSLVIQLKFFRSQPLTTLAWSEKKLLINFPRKNISQ